jgi:hypothetical protein
MVLGEKTFKAGDENEWPGERNLDKTDCSNCTDEFEFVLENFTVDANDAEVADSVGLLAAKKTIEDQPMKLFWKAAPVISMSEPALAQTGFSTKDSAVTVLPVEPIVPSPIEQKYIARKKVFATEIPVSGDSIELHFYDNGQVDGDSISLFLNDKLIFEHIRLTDKAYLIKLAVTDLNTTNELIMVAENLGSISPNTSYMIATIGDQKYEARLESTEGSSALIRLVKPTDQR